MVSSIQFNANKYIIISGALTGAITQGQGGPESNDNEGVLHTPKWGFRTGASLPRIV